MPINLTEPPVSGENVVEDLLKASDRPVRIRLQPTIYDAERKAYRAWAGASWGVTVDSLEEALEVRDLLEAVLRAAAIRGPKLVHELVVKAVTG